MKLLSAVDDNTTGASISIPLQDRTYTFFASGTFGSGTVTLHISPDDGVTFVPLAASALTAAGSVTLPFRATAIRAVLAGATSPSLSAWLL
jgi:hypothetical protein